PTAERFAHNLTAQLAQLQQSAQAWKAEAIASQQANVDELARRIDQFVEFRTELVRRGRDEGPAAARAFGDNDANRSVRTALNQTLSALAQAYEREIGVARGEVETNQRFLMAALMARAGGAVLVLLGGLFLVRWALLAPLLRLKEAMLRLARGDLET